MAVVTVAEAEAGAGVGGVVGVVTVIVAAMIAPKVVVDDVCASRVIVS